jgi:hypothetical protein
MDDLIDRLGELIGRHTVAPITALRDAGILSWILAGIWLLWPVALQTVFHPSDAVGFQSWIQGLPVAEYISRQAWAGGLIISLLALAVLGLVHFLVLLLIYRRTQMEFSLWLIGLLGIAVVANGVWWLRTGYFDLSGAFAGLGTPAILIVCEMVFEALGKEFVFGKGNRVGAPY